MKCGPGLKLKLNKSLPEKKYVGYLILYTWSQSSISFIVEFTFIWIYP